jgi:hypothetical protein
MICYCQSLHFNLILGFDLSFIRRLQRLQSFTMPEYFIEEYADMYFVYGKYGGKATAGVRRYANACIRANGGHLL